MASYFNRFEITFIKMFFGAVVIVIVSKSQPRLGFVLFACNIVLLCTQTVKLVSGGVILRIALPLVKSSR
jgi:hypothetical protein